MSGDEFRCVNCCFVENSTSPAHSPAYDVSETVDEDKILSDVEKAETRNKRRLTEEPCVMVGSSTFNTSGLTLSYIDRQI